MSAIIAQNHGNNLGRTFHWTNIILQFEATFKKSFTANKKAHFDNLPEEYKVVDGAKMKWSNLLLIDAIIYILQSNQFNNSSRRAFNQHRVLYEAIMDELKIIDFAAYREIIEDKTLQAFAPRGAVTDSQEVAEKAEKFSYLTVGKLEVPWNSMHNLQLSLLDTPPSKAKNKYVTIVSLLTGNEIFKKYNFDLDVIVQLVVSKVMFVFTHKMTLSSAPTTPQAASNVVSPVGARLRVRANSMPAGGYNHGYDEETDETSADSTGNSSPAVMFSAGLHHDKQKVMIKKEYMSSTRAFNLPDLRVDTSAGSNSIVGAVQGLHGPDGSHGLNHGGTSSCPARLSKSAVTSPANKNKRCQGVNNNAKKRPSLDQVNYVFSISESQNESLVSPVLKHTLSGMHGIAGDLHYPQTYEQQQQSLCDGQYGLYYQQDMSSPSRQQAQTQQDDDASCSSFLDEFADSGSFSFKLQALLNPDVPIKQEEVKPKARAVSLSAFPAATGDACTSGLGNNGNGCGGVSTSSMVTCLDTLQQQESFYDETFRITEDEYDLLMDCNYDEDCSVTFDSLMGNENNNDNNDDNTVDTNTVGELLKSDLIPTPNTSGKITRGSKSSGKKQQQQLVTVKQETKSPTEEMLENVRRNTEAEARNGNCSYTTHHKVPVITSVDPAHFFTMSPICNLDPLGYQQSGAAAVYGHGPGCDKLTRARSTSQESQDSCATCTSLAFEPYYLPPPLPYCHSGQSASDFSVESSAASPNKVFLPYGGYVSRNSDSVCTTAAASRRSSHNTEHFDPNCSMSSAAFAAAQAANGMSGASGFNDCYYYPQQQHNGGSQCAPLPHASGSLRCTSADVDTMTHRLTDTFTIHCGASADQTTIAHGQPVQWKVV